MREPLRWKDTGDGPAGARELLSRAEVTRALGYEEKTRTAARLATIAVAPAAAGAWLWGAGVAAAATAALGAMAAVHLTHVREERSRGLATRSVQVASAPSSPSPQDAPNVPAATDVADDRARAASPLPAPTSAPRFATTRPHASSAPSSSEPSSPEDALLRETALLEQARSLLSSDPTAALTILAQHRREFPRGQLGVEAELLTVDALERLGRNRQARRRGEALLARVRGTIYQARVERLLAGLPP